MFYEKLDYVLAVESERNLTRAAQKLAISQPTLTLYLNRLEADLGVKLFDRSHSPLTITEAGLFYIEKMKAIYNSEQALRNDIQKVAAPEKTLVIGIGQVKGAHWLPMLLPPLLGIHPELNIETVQTSDDRLVSFTKTGKIDFSIGVLPISRNDLCSIELSKERLLIAIHKRYGIIPPEERSRYSYKNPCVIEPDRLNMVPFITPYIASGMYGDYERAILNNHIIPLRTISTSNLNTGFHLALRGLGAQLLSSPVIQMNPHLMDQIQDMDFCIFESMPHTRTCYAYYHESNIKKALILDAVRIIQEEVIPAIDY